MTLSKLFGLTVPANFLYLKSYCSIASRFLYFLALIIFTSPLIACNNVINLPFFFGNLDHCVIHYITSSQLTNEDKSLNFDANFRIPTVIEVVSGNGVYDSSTSVFKIYGTKFTPCLVTLCNTNVISFVEKGELYVNLQMNVNILEKLILSHENPHIFSYLNFNYLLRHIAWFRMVRNPYTGQAFALTSTFFVIHKTLNSFELEIVCIVCWPPNQPQPSIIQDASLEFEESFHAVTVWKQIHSNMQLSWVPYQAYSFYDRICTDLSKFSVFHPVSSSYCTFYFLSKKLNFSRSQAFHYQTPISNIHTGHVASRTFTKMIFLEKNIDKNVWFSYACSYNPYIFVTFFQSQHMYANTLMKPFDSYIWILSIVSLFGTSIVMTWLSSNNLKGIIGRFRNLFLFCISVLLEQSDESMTREFRSSDLMGESAAFLSTVWLLACFVLGAGYKAAFSSVLTAKLPPILPQSIRELMTTGIMYGSTTKHLYLGNPYSTLRDQVITDLWDPDAKDWSYNNFLHHFLQACNFFNGSDIDLVLNISQNSPIRIGNALVPMPSTFAVISIEKDVLSFTRLMTKFTNFSAILNTDLSPFITRYPWYGGRTFFSEFFSDGLARLYESGIYNYWNFNHEIHLQYAEMKEKHQLENLRQSIEGFNYLAQLFVKPSNEKSFGLTQLEQPIILESVLAAFISYGSILGVAIIVLIMEKLWSLGRRNTTDVFEIQ